MLVSKWNLKDIIGRNFIFRNKKEYHLSKIIRRKIELKLKAIFISFTFGGILSSILNDFKRYNTRSRWIKNRLSTYMAVSSSKRFTRLAWPHLIIRSGSPLKSDSRDSLGSSSSRMPDGVRTEWCSRQGYFSKEQIHSHTIPELNRSVDNSLSVE